MEDTEKYPPRKPPRPTAEMLQPRGDAGVSGYGRSPSGQAAPLLPCPRSLLWWKHGGYAAPPAFNRGACSGRPRL